MQDQGNKSARVGLAMTTSAKVQMSSLVNTMSTRQRKELNLVERSACNCSRPTWKLASCIMAAKVSRIASWVPVHSLP